MLTQADSWATSFPGSLIFLRPHSLAPGGGKMGDPGNDVDSWAEPIRDREKKKHDSQPI